MMEHEFQFFNEEYEFEDSQEVDGERTLKVRLDKWLWAARFFKTRALARAAVEAGKVFYNSERSKPSREIEVGAELYIRQGRFEKTVIVTGLSTRRRSTEEALQLFEETAASQSLREQQNSEINSDNGFYPRPNYGQPQYGQPRSGHFQPQFGQRPPHFSEQGHQHSPRSSNPHFEPSTPVRSNPYHEPSFAPRSNHHPEHSQTHRSHSQGPRSSYYQEHTPRTSTYRDPSVSGRGPHYSEPVQPSHSDLDYESSQPLHNDSNAVYQPNHNHGYHHNDRERHFDRSQPLHNDSQPTYQPRPHNGDRNFAGQTAERRNTRFLRRSPVKAPYGQQAQPAPFSEPVRKREVEPFDYD